MATPLSRTQLGVITAATVGNMVGLTAAVHAPFGIFLIPLSQSFGWPRAAVSVVLGIVSIVGALIYPLAGRYVDGNGARRMLIAGNVALAAAISLLAFSNGSLALFYATFTLIGLVGAFSAASIYSKVVSDWFVDNRGTMLGLSGGVGNGVGATIFPVLAAILVGNAGWRAGYLGIAAGVVLLGLPFLLLGLRDVPRYSVAAAHEVVHEPGLSLTEAARTPVFWLLLISIASGAGCTTAIFSHVVPILAERGASVAVGTSVLSVFALVTAAWQVATGTILDRTTGPRIVAPMLLLAVAGLALLEFGNGMPALLLGGALLGLGLGSQYGALPFLIARYFGLRCFGAIIGAMYSAVVLLQGATPILLDHAFDVQGTYRFAIETIGICLTFGAALLVLLPGYARVNREIALPTPVHG